MRVNRFGFSWLRCAKPSPASFHLAPVRMMKMSARERSVSTAAHQCPVRGAQSQSQCASVRWPHARTSAVQRDALQHRADLRDHIVLGLDRRGRGVEHRSQRAHDLRAGGGAGRAARGGRSGAGGRALGMRTRGEQRKQRAHQHGGSPAPVASPTRQQRRHLRRRAVQTVCGGPLADRCEARQGRRRPRADSAGRPKRAGRAKSRGHGRAACHGGAAVSSRGRYTPRARGRERGALTPLRPSPGLAEQGVGVWAARHAGGERARTRCLCAARCVGAWAVARTARARLRCVVVTRRSLESSAAAA